MYSSPADRPSSLFPHLRFCLQAEQLLVHPPTLAGANTAWRPLSRLPSSLFEWMLGASKMFWQEHQRCIAFVLLYRLDRSHWSIELPSQSCRHDLAKWSPALSAPIDAHDGYALAGTFQSRILPKDPDLLTIAPDDPGLHFFYNPGSRRIDVRAALRYTDPALATRVIDPTHVIEDDKAALLESARDRLELV